ncbi:MAG: hypothetical protein ACRDEA_21900, partial [Microcystaceae cyanobacterium]
MLERMIGKKLEISYETLQSLAPNEQLNYFKEQLQKVNLLPPEAETAQVHGLVQVFKANHQTHYMPKEVYPTRITLLRCSEVHHEDVPSETLAEILREPSWGWNQFSTDPVEVHLVSGDHLTMLAQPHVQGLAERLRDCLERSQADD